MCVECGTVLSVSSSPVALQERAFIREQIAAGKDKQQIKAALVEEYGEGVLADPAARGFNADAVDRPDRARRCSPRSGSASRSALARATPTRARGGAAAAAERRGRAAPGRGARPVTEGARPHRHRRLRGRLRLVHLALRAAARAGLPVGGLGRVAGRHAPASAACSRSCCPRSSSACRSRRSSSRSG